MAAKPIKGSRITPEEIKEMVILYVDIVLGF